ncbi:unnamed protein product [Boreogadus saida]
MRRAIATALLENTDDLTEVCHQCGQTDNPETDEDVQWISCERCQRWYHQSCAKRMMESPHLCLACNTDRTARRERALAR